MLCSKQIFILAFALVGLVGLGMVRPTHDLSSTESPSQAQPFLALVVPHHDLILVLFQSFYNSISQSERARVRQIIFLAPNHFQPEQTVIKTTSLPLVYSALQVVPINQKRAAELTSIGVVDEPTVFKNEHAIMLHVPLIQENFPQAEVTPLLFTQNIPVSMLDELSFFLKKQIDDADTLVIVSTDFSHYLSEFEAKQNDQHTLELIHAGDKQAMLGLSDDYVDCPACLYVLLSLLDTNRVPELLFHGNSAQFMSLAEADPTTSYCALRW
ncbi:AmmeMemoRadiSam system protein B [Candidatus Woesebacteria bacterium]|nr:AmmeMemoRadiSam system protein B [Candidatus Woesebacteria bacterium]